MSEVASRRVHLLGWLRRTHGWFGLWGAVLGLLFGVSGVLLNHRNILKIPAAASQETTVQLAVPQPAPATSADWVNWLQQEVAPGRPPGRVRVEPAQPVAWGERSVTQPERWQVTFAAPNSSVQAEYWVGNGFVSVKHSEHNGWAMLNNLHKGTGMGVGWILLADTLAGSIIVLSITGTLLWTQLNRRRLVGVALFGTSLTWLVVSLVRAL